MGFVARVIHLVLVMFRTSCLLFYCWVGLNSCWSDLKIHLIHVREIILWMVFLVIGLIYLLGFYALLLETPQFGNLIKWRLSFLYFDL